MSTTSLPAGSTVSPSALGGQHTTTQHTVTGECVHINWCTSEAMAVQHVPTLQTVLYCVLSWVVATGGGKVPLLLGPVLVVDCYLWETWDGWCTGSVTTDKLSVTLPVCHQS